MNTTELHTLFTQLIGLPAETECVEFKEAKQTYDFGKIGKYFSALSNEANLKGKTSAWLLFGVKDKPIPRTIVGSSFRVNRADLDSLKAEIAHKTTNRITFNEIYELHLTQGRVVLFDIPAAPKGFPIAWEGHYYGRDGEDISPLNLVEIEQIRNQATRFDWSAQIIPEASIDDLDEKAIAVAKENYKTKFPHLAQEVDEWQTSTFLNKAKVTIGGKITNTAILLLGKSESEHFISPAQAKITWILKDHKGDEIDYEHFDAPFLLAVNHVFSKIRNLKYRYLKNKSLFPQEVDMYDAYVIREALHNCLAHQDYTLAGRVIVVEFPKRLLFSNEGDFIPENVSEVLHRDSPDTFSRNKFLTNAMFTLNMIDTIGSGIKRMFNKQKDRYFPLPEYQIKKSTVSVGIYGEILNFDYASYLATHKETTLDEAIVLDKAQKGNSLTEAETLFLKEIGFSEKSVHQKSVHQKSVQQSVNQNSPKYLKTAKNNNIILNYCREPRNREDILNAINVTKHWSNFKRHIQPLIDVGFIEMTDKTNPKSKNQKYILTQAGLNFLANSFEDTNHQ